MKIFDTYDRDRFLAFINPVLARFENSSPEERQQLAKMFCPDIRQLLSDHHNSKDSNDDEVVELLYIQGWLLEGVANHQKALAHYEEALKVCHELNYHTEARSRILCQRGIDRCLRKLTKLVAHFALPVPMTQVDSPAAGQTPDEFDPQTPMVTKDDVDPPDTARTQHDEDPELVVPQIPDLDFDPDIDSE